MARYETKNSPARKNSKKRKRPIKRDRTVCEVRQFHFGTKCYQLSGFRTRKRANVVTRVSGREKHIAYYFLVFSTALITMYIFWFYMQLNDNIVECYTSLNIIFKRSSAYNLESQASDRKSLLQFSVATKFLLSLWDMSNYLIFSYFC